MALPPNTTFWRIWFLSGEREMERINPPPPRSSYRRGPIWGRPRRLPVYSPHWQQLPIILPGHWPIRTGLPWLPAHTLALALFSPPTASAYSWRGGRYRRDDSKKMKRGEHKRGEVEKWKRRAGARSTGDSITRVKSTQRSGEYRRNKLLVLKTWKRQRQSAKNEFRGCMLYANAQPLLDVELGDPVF